MAFEGIRTDKTLLAIAIIYKKQILLQKRVVEPYAGWWTLPTKTLKGKESDFDGDVFCLATELFRDLLPSDRDPQFIARGARIRNMQTIQIVVAVYQLPDSAEYKPVQEVSFKFLTEVFGDEAVVDSVLSVLGASLRNCLGLQEISPDYLVHDHVEFYIFPS